MFPSSSSPVARVSTASSMGVKPAGNLAVVAPVERPVSLGLPDFSMVPSMADKIVSNELFELLDEMTKTRFSHLLISESDDVYVKQIKSLSTEILLLRSQVEDKMVQKSVSSNSGVDPRVSDVGKEPRISASSYSSWKNVVNPVKEVQHLKLKFIPPTMLHDRVSVSPPATLGVEGAERWQRCMVGYFLDKKLSFKAVESIASKIWGPLRLQEVLSNDKGFFFFMFKSREDFLRIIDLGPWHFGGKLLLLKKWEPGMVFEKEQLSKIPIWVQFYNIPFEY